jgi:hypothetical protein
LCFSSWIKCFRDMKMSLVLLLSSVVLPLVNDVTSCKLFHKKDKWHNWSKLYYSWIKLTLLTMYKSSFLYIKWNKIQLWKLVCFIMQLKWNSTTTYANIVKKTSAPKKISYIMHNFPVYYVCNHFLHKNYFSFS